MQQPHNSSILALDVGEKRIGVALASAAARLAQPLTTLANDEQFLKRLTEIIEQEEVDTLVVGLPRGLDGQSTDQTHYVEVFAEKLSATGLTWHFQDEAVTSAHAEEELRNRGVRYTKEDVDALSATYILQDYLQEARDANNG